MTAARWELDALARLDASRDEIEAVLTGHVAAEVAVIEAVARLVESAAEALRYRDACLREVA